MPIEVQSCFERPWLFFTVHLNNYPENRMQAKKIVVFHILLLIVTMLSMVSRSNKYIGAVNWLGSTCCFLQERVIVFILYNQIRNRFLSGIQHPKLELIQISLSFISE